MQAFIEEITLRDTSGIQKIPVADNDKLLRVVNRGGAPKLAILRDADAGGVRTHEDVVQVSVAAQQFTVSTAVPSTYGYLGNFVTDAQPSVTYFASLLRRE